MQATTQETQAVEVLAGEGDEADRKRAMDLQLLAELLEDDAQVARTPRAALTSTRHRRGDRSAIRLALRYLWAVRHAPDVEVAAAARSAAQAVAAGDAVDEGPERRRALLESLDAQLQTWRAPRTSSLATARNRVESVAVRCLWAERGEPDAVVATLARRIVAGLFPGVAALAPLLSTPPAWVTPEGTVLREDGSVAYMAFPAAEPLGTVNGGAVQFVPCHLERVDAVQDGDDSPQVVEGPVTVQVGPVRLTVAQAAVLRDVLAELVASAGGGR